MATNPLAGKRDLLRICTAGSVDDGKSTLVGRLLFDTRSILDDQMTALEDASRRMGDDTLNLALITDGLRAEREQRITIDVAYRYFTTRRRKFVIADTPGHLQYTRNMVTGASAADLAIVLVDASLGVLTQSQRHAFIASLLGIPHLIVAINKMDLIDYAESGYDAIVERFAAFARKLTIADITYIPISALNGDNVVTPSTRMPWYQGGPLLHRLETASAGSRNSIDFRFPVQCVIRPDPSFRGYAGTVASGSVSRGEEVVVLPSNIVTRIATIETFDGPRDSAGPGAAVILTTTDQVDVSRGDMVVRRKNVPLVTTALDAYLCWMNAEPLVPDRTYLLAQTTRRVQARVTGVDYRIDIDTLHRDTGATHLVLNDIGRVAITTADAVFVDSYRTNPATGHFILIDPHSNQTVAAGMVRGVAAASAGSAPSQAGQDRPQSPGVVAQAANITREAREARNGHRAGVIWLTGLPGAGKTTIARELERRLFETGHATAAIDGDDLRHGLCGDLGFGPAERAENVRRAGEVARLFFENGSIALCALVSPYRADRSRVRGLLPEGRFIEVHVMASDETRRARDPKGHYARAAAGQIEQFTGVSAPYEAPAAPELTIDTDTTPVEDATDRIVALLRDRGWLKPLT
ncbi:MAG: adenylyl-sulfate kinase [Vicinamibacterales bacterium]